MRPSGRPIKEYDGALNDGVLWLDPFSETKDDFKESLRIISQVHGNGTLPVVVAHNRVGAGSKNSDDPDTYGWYLPALSSSDRDQLAIRPDLTTEQAILCHIIHEFGHHVWEYLPRSFVSRDVRREYDSLCAVLNRTTSIHRLWELMPKAIEAHTAMTAAQLTGRDAKGSFLSPENNVDYLAYWLKPSEIFARAYVSFIVGETAKQTRLHKEFDVLLSAKQLGEVRLYWDLRFEPNASRNFEEKNIKIAFRRLLSEIGWMQP